MRLATVSHSHIHLRQQLFFKELSRQGHEVLMVAPGEWRDLRAKPHGEGSWRLETCRHFGGEDVYSYRLLGAGDLVEAFSPDWLYVQAEPGSAQASEALNWAGPWRRALFTWENISLRSRAEADLGRCDLVVCGNPDAEALVKPHQPNTALLLQVGVDTDHFQARPGVPRDIRVAYMGRPIEEKGLPYLMQAWPTAQVLPWKDFRELPWWYSQVQVVVAYSQDVPWWREQAPNYVVLEALSCGCRAVVSDTAAMAFWLKYAPGVVIVEGHQGEAFIVGRLRAGIRGALEMDVGNAGREWVVERFSNPVVAKKLLEVLGA